MSYNFGPPMPMTHGSALNHPTPSSSYPPPIVPVSYTSIPGQIGGRIVVEPFGETMILAAEGEFQRFNQEMVSLQERSRSTGRQIVASGAKIPELPVEILRRIFIACVATQSVDGSLGVDLNFVLTKTGPEVRLALCQVCVRWRAIVLGTQELWSDVRVRFVFWEADHEISNFGPAFSLLDTWLSMGGQCPLNLTMLWTNNHPRILQTLVKSAPRIRSLKFSPIRWKSVRSFLQLPPVSLERLEKICIDNLSDSIASAAKNTTVFLTATHLRSVSLRGFPRMKLDTLAIPWGQLTELFIREGNVPMTELNFILPLCVNLARAGLFISDTQPTPQRMAMPTLCWLKLDCNILDDAAQFLHHVSFPSLLELVLNCDVFPRTSTPPTLPPFLPTVRRLSITRSNRKAYDPTCPWNWPFAAPWRTSRHPVPLPWLAACNLAQEVFLPHSPLGEELVTMISEGALLPNVQLLVVPTQDFGLALSMICARLGSIQSSTITEFGISG
ncbi:hypothetical protein FB45DRAFT_459637 [Roridomyces roridus]|uniref:F-box domain-containing protein n=1 Tax=Roridomyces roridus TaxID=1738132 RepID=A0AAD7B114_9AGAR|nr:hypothetical protein FB45DRAFT_459637 [Roridomyces roridus]